MHGEVGVVYEGEGGGLSACIGMYMSVKQPESQVLPPSPLASYRVPVINCIKCHLGRIIPTYIVDSIALNKISWGLYKEPCGVGASRCNSEEKAVKKADSGRKRNQILGCCS